MSRLCFLVGLRAEHSGAEEAINSPLCIFRVVVTSVASARADFEWLPQTDAGGLRRLQACDVPVELRCPIEVFLAAAGAGASPALSGTSQLLRVIIVGGNQL